MAGSRGLLLVWLAPMTGIVTAGGGRLLIITAVCLGLGAVSLAFTRLDCPKNPHFKTVAEVLPYGRTLAEKLSRKPSPVSIFENSEE